MKLKISKQRAIAFFVALLGLFPGLKRQREESPPVHNLPMAEAMIHYSGAPEGFNEEIISE
ncbi:MAG: hypothetical protein KBD65_02800 [Candidatus Moranbacteria bacterium]|jgi:hypothetical protein|nr:hypothetical protein [Candidatus Moranbacteria bacterium]